MIDFLCIATFLYSIYLIFIKSNEKLPIVELFFFFYSLNYLFIPMLFYNGLETRLEYLVHQKMGTDKSTYFLYVIPSFFAFIFGLSIRKIKIDYNETIKLLNRNKIKNLDIILISIGLFFSVTSNIYPSFLAFPVFILSNLQYAGLIYSVLINSSWLWYLLPVVLLRTISISLTGGMFGEFFSWALFIILFFFLKRKPKFITKLVAFFIGLIFTILMQNFKSSYREIIWGGQGEDGSLELFTQNAKSNIAEGQTETDNLLASTERFNQGYFLSNVLITVPGNENFQNGDHFNEIFKAILLPRFLYEDKIKSGGSILTQKYTGLSIGDGTSMAIGLFGDAYIDFGYIGGIALCFLIGFFIIFMVNLLANIILANPINLIFLPIVLYYTIRPDNETHTALNHLVKSILVIYILDKLLPIFLSKKVQFK